MTRDEAIALFNRHVWPHGPSAGRETPAAKWVDLFAALDLLKLDAPLTPKQKAINAIVATPDLKHTVPIVLFRALDQAGLTIVEK